MRVGRREQVRQLYIDSVQRRALSTELCRASRPSHPLDRGVVYLDFFIRCTHTSNSDTDRWLRLRLWSTTTMPFAKFHTVDIRYLWLQFLRGWIAQLLTGMCSLYQHNGWKRPHLCGQIVRDSPDCEGSVLDDQTNTNIR